MKYLILFSVAFIFLNCSTKKLITSSDLDKTLSLVNCPKDGVCTFEVFINKNLNLRKDGIDALYPELSEGKNTVIKFEYKRNEIPNTADSGYSEIIYAEIQSDLKEIELKNEALVEAKIVFGRLCFCRGETGYYPITEGVFKVWTNKDGTKTYSLSFKIHEVPQIINMFQETQ